MLKNLRGKIASSLKLKDHFLFLLLCALMLPPISVVMVTAFAHISQEKAMEAAVGSYVQDLAESVAYRLNSESMVEKLNPIFFGDAPRYRIFSWGPSIPGWLAHISNDGKIILASPGAANIAAIWNKELPIGTATRVKDKYGAQYTLAVYPVSPGGGYVVVAVAWDQLLGGLVQTGRLWPVLIAFMTIGSFAGIRLLWRRLVSPLQGLAAEIDDLRVGKDLPNSLDPCAAKEIESVHNALLRFARAAVERDNLRNSYVRDIVRVQEAERMDMAREIHDGPLQDITALLQQIHISLEEENPAERIKKTERLAKAVVRELRGLCDELAPPWMDLGLSHALNEFSERMSQNYDITVTAEVEVDFEPEPEKTLSFVRIFQEAVSNAVRHGEASEIKMRVFEEAGNLILDIKDNGKGFCSDSGLDHESLRLEGHRGLANMTERMSLMGGVFSISSNLGVGTAIRCSLPLKPESELAGI